MRAPLGMLLGLICLIHATDNLETAHCDTLVKDWVSKHGFSCEDHEKQGLCTNKGELGHGWDAAWGSSFADEADGDGIDATQACCQCGGGVTWADSEAPTPSEGGGLLVTNDLERVGREISQSELVFNESIRSFLLFAR